MSVARPTSSGGTRCPGVVAEQVRELPATRVDRARLVGRCPVCRRLFDVTKAGRLRPHVMYHAPIVPPDVGADVPGGGAI